MNHILVYRHPMISESNIYCLHITEICVKDAE